MFKKVIVILMFIVFLVSGCKGKDETDAAGEQTTLAALSATYTQPPGVLGDTLSDAVAGTPTETLSPTPNDENDRPAPPTEGPKPTSTRTPLPSVTPTFTPSPTPTKTPLFSATPTIYKNPTTTFTASPTSTGTLPTPTQSNTPGPTETDSETPTNTASPTQAPGVAFTVQFEGHYSCENYEYLTFYVQNTGSLSLESNHVLLEDTLQVVVDGFTNWPFQTLATGCDIDLGVLQPGESAYLPIVIEVSPAPPPFSEEHTGTFTFCSEQNQHGICEVLDLTFTVP